MKRILLSSMLLAIASLSYSQSLIDDIYNRYTGKSGFTSIAISPQIFQLIAFIDKEDQELDNIADRFTGLKILVSENKDEGFASDIQNLISKSNYQNLMKVIEADKKVDFYAKESDGKIVDLLMHAVEKDEEVILSISGIFSIEELGKIGHVGTDDDYSYHLSLLKNLENN